MRAYGRQIEARFRQPRFAGAPEKRANLLTGEARTPGSDAVLRFYLDVDAGIVASAQFQAFGCPATIAAGDWACEWLNGRSLDQAGAFSAAGMETALELPPDKRHVALLVEDALKELQSANGI